MNNEILELMKTRQAVKPRNGDEYKEVNKAIKRKCSEAKEKWLNAECVEIERLSNRDAKDMHKKIRELTNRNQCSNSGCIKAKDGSVLLEKEEILERWSEYIEELFDDNRTALPELRKNISGPKILKSEIEAAINKIKKNKAQGPDNIVIEMIQATGDFGIDKITEISNEIYDSGKIPEDLTKSIFIALPKKPGATECELHRTISLMSHVIKIILRVLMMRARRCTRPEISKVQCGFTEDTGTRNAIFILRNLCERAIEVQKDLYVCFIDYTKAFDKVRHCDMLDILQELDIDGKDIRLIRNLHWNQKASIRIDGEYSRFSNIKRGVRQGCVLSPDLFNLYSENILRGLHDIKGLRVGGYNFNNLRYADDIVLIAESQEKLQEMLNVIVERSAERGLSVNLKKTECMVVSKKINNPACNITIGNQIIKQVNRFEYLGTTITSDGRCDTEIKKRIAIAKNAFSKMDKLFKDRKLSMKIKTRLLRCYILPILIYGSEGWTISATMNKRLEASEMWFLRRILRISYVDHVTNDEVLKRANAKRSLINTIRDRQMKFLGHIMRNKEIESLTITGKIDGEKARGRQRLTFCKNLSEWMGINEMRMLKVTRDREMWKIMTANALIEHGT